MAIICASSLYTAAFLWPQLATVCCPCLNFIRECNPCCFEGVSVNYFSGQDERPGGFSDGLCVSIVDKPLAFDYKLIRDQHVAQATTDWPFTVLRSLTIRASYTASISK